MAISRTRRRRWHVKIGPFMALKRRTMISDHAVIRLICILRRVDVGNRFVRIGVILFARSPRTRIR
jgi:hypothetical protein